QLEVYRPRAPTKIKDYFGRFTYKWEASMVDGLPTELLELKRSTLQKGPPVFLYTLLEVDVVLLDPEEATTVILNKEKVKDVVVSGKTAIIPGVHFAKTPSVTVQSIHQTRNAYPIQNNDFLLMIQLPTDLSYVLRHPIRRFLKACVHGNRNKFSAFCLGLNKKHFTAADSRLFVMSVRKVFVVGRTTTGVKAFGVNWFICQSNRKLLALFAYWLYYCTTRSILRHRSYIVQPATELSEGNEENTKSGSMRIGNCNGDFVLSPATPFVRTPLARTNGLQPVRSTSVTGVCSKLTNNRSAVTLSVYTCRVSRRKHEGCRIFRLSKPEQEQSRCLDEDRECYGFGSADHETEYDVIKFHRNPREVTSVKASNRKPGNGTVTPNRTTAWGSLRAINSASHDYQNVEPAPRAHDDLSMDKTRTQHGSLGRREHKSNDALVNESLDLELLWSDHGRLQQASVLHEFRAKRPDELDLVMHETVVLLDPAGSSGWVKVRSLIDGNEGLVPLNYLRLHQPQIISRSQLETDNEDEVEGSQLDDKAVPNTSTAAVIPPKIANASPYENIVAPPPRVEEEVIKHSKSHLPSYGAKGNSELHQNSIPTASGDQFKSINVGHHTQPTTSATPDIKKPGKHLPIPGSFVRTLIEFEGNHPDELHFSPGSVIRVLGRAPVPDCATDTSHPDEQSPLNRLNNSITSGVDDGWWEGELLVPSSDSATTQQYARIRGVFPSMLIHPMSSEDAEPWELVWKNSVPNQPQLNGNECDANSDRKTVPSGLQTEHTSQDDTTRCTLKTTPVSNTDRSDAPHSDGDYIQLKSEQLTNSRPVEHGHSPQVLTRAMLQQAAHDEPEDEVRTSIIFRQNHIRIRKSLP
ncbi:hypothetical protein CLF_100043, partial [Clonorchis sinensis]